MTDQNGNRVAVRRENHKMPNGTTKKVWAVYVEKVCPIMGASVELVGWANTKASAEYFAKHNQR